jgi:uncharacterized delta-60 repeat protein
MLDPNFGVGGQETTRFPFPSYDYGRSITVDSLGRIVVAGYSYTTNGQNNDFTVARFNSAGTLDPTFGGTGLVTVAFGAFDDYAYGVAVDSLDRVVVAGSTFNGSNYDFAVARLTTDGALDSSFDGDGKQTIAFGTSWDTANAVAVDSIDRVVVAGYTFDGSSYDFAVARLTVAGATNRPGARFARQGIVPPSYADRPFQGRNDYVAYQLAVRAESTSGSRPCRPAAAAADAVGRGTA